ncbi:hypothetical protein AB0L86_07890 [Micromonospora musae]|uniref:hypothetical protein n=1 Tax=Micromonospora musae TaxID=1894970 RepID=UPI00343C733F
MTTLRNRAKIAACLFSERTMPRKRPRELRRSLSTRSASSRYGTRAYRFSVLPGLSGRGLTAIRNLELARLWPGAVAEVLEIWEEMVRHPAHRLRDPGYRAAEEFHLEFLSPAGARAVLEVVAYALPKQDARTFRRRLAVLDEMW